MWRAGPILALLLPLWEQGCWSLISVSGAFVSSGAQNQAPHSAEGPSELLRRHKRSWVWNQFFVLEEYTGEEPLYVGKLHSDMDKGDGKVKYVLSGQGATSIFTIDESTGDIHATKRLDREEQAYYTLQARAVDRKTEIPVEPISEFVVKVQDINDNEPKFMDGPYMAGVPEMSALGTTVVQVAATDADDPTYGNSARVVYSIISGQPYFSVDPKTGVIRTALPNMDREMKDQYVLVIQAKDMVGQMGGLSGTTSVTVTLTDVNDNPPRFSRKNYQYTVLESLPVASVVARVKAADADIGSNAEMEYQIMEDGPGVFNITTDEDTQEGVIILQKPLDFETKNSYNLRIEATNRNIDPAFVHLGSFSDTTFVKVTVEDVNEPPVFTTQLSKMVVPEDASVGSPIGRVSAHDPDSSNSPVRYSIDRNTDLERFFNVDALSGFISTAKPLDREVNSVHNLTILAMESQDPTQIGKGFAAITVLDINDNAPVFAIEYETLLCENAAPGQVIQTISAVDKDEPPSGHQFYFALPASVAGNSNFTLRDNKDNTASIVTKRGGFRRREQVLYRLPVLIVDSGSPALSSTNTLSVSVCDCDSDGVAQSCGAVAYTLPAGLSTGALVAILGCIITLLVMVLLIVSMHRRKKEPLILEEERDVRENIVRYDDEGGGEEDTEAFDMVALRNLNIIRDPKVRRDVTPDTPTFFPYPTSSSSRPVYKTLPDNVVFREFIWDRLKDADVDPSAPPYDSLQTYAFEGSGSVAESLSSLESLSTDSEQNYDYLSNWGPRFKKLADLYGNSDGNSVFS
ncbi:cadherin-7 isoform X1 [Esox lucius]|uniref:cadherin-7 isoform X1 n=3 Tax=Esox lucius TaxID=8010 RepID=UPI00066196C0|nr:cadherin-7 isoform X1 [Esox lucius]XP_019900723.1 cadherin-7 isoform X1 [Esox lucius]XP_019900724.1 cadherin-7 isoform X1 [Esox lucius]